MKGTRLPDGEVDPWPPQNGAYWRGQGRADAQDLVWFCVTPNGLYGNLASHTVTEHDDGTISVSPSILVKAHDGSFHGYLERGIWREC